MSHNSNYSSVGENNITTLNEDYVLATADTAGTTAIPYIIRHFTNGERDYIPIPEHVSTEKYLGTANSLNNKTFVISNTQKQSNRNVTMYLKAEEETGISTSVTGRQHILKAVTLESATKFTFHKITINDNDYYTISFVYGAGDDAVVGTEDDIVKYLKVTDANTNYSNQERGNLEIADDSNDSGCWFTASYTGTNWHISGVTTDNNGKNHTEFIAGSIKNNQWFFNSYEKSDDPGVHLDLWENIPETRTYTYVYPARCVTKASGYYNINLTGSDQYYLPDSFRGLGCVGNNNTAYELKINKFDGKGKTIDEDIYLNKFKTDNYFNVIHSVTTQATNSGTAYGVNKEQAHHGIGLFDSIVTSGADSMVTSFTLSGSVNTEIYKDGYNPSAQEQTIYSSDDANFISVGGVCGSTNSTSTYLTFDQVNLNQLTVCGSCVVGGLLGYSNNQNPKDSVVPVTVNECNATDLSIKMNSSSGLSSVIQARNAMGGFVGKCVEGKVVITGNTTSRSNVTIKAFGFEPLSGVTDHRSVAGGLVGFAGNGCTVSDMNVSPSTGYTVEIGSDYTGYAGGLVGLMQPSTEGGTSCVTNFTNCTVEKINVNGHYAGGFYGGKWFDNNNKYVPYSITLDNCQMVGDTSTNNTIKGNYFRDANGYAGGFLGCGNVYTNGSPNIEIKDCKVSHYTISSAAGAKGFAGGFIGYTGSSVDGSSITCYIHDSSVENCTIGTENNYAGGAIGQVYRRSNNSTNKILGYNIKLDTVEISGAYNGAWIGHLGETKANITTSIQFTGLGIYGKNYARNIGNWSDEDNRTNTKGIFRICRL